MFALVAATACADDVGANDVGPDAADAAADVRVMATEPTPPAPPALPELTPCPAGWQEVDVGAVTACEPWPTDTAPCDFPDVRFVGDPACAPLGPACPLPGEWPADLPTDGSVVYVRWGAPSGDGTMGAPLGTLAEALTAATAGQTIALTAGTYAGGGVLQEGVTLRGACVAETEIVGAPGDISEATIFAAQGTTVRDLRIRGERSGLITNRPGTVTLRNLWISGAVVGIGISNAGVMVDGESLVVEDVTVGDATGVGVVVLAGAVAELRRVQVRAIVGTGVGASAGARLSLTDASIHDSFAPEGSAAGVGASSLNQGRLELRRVLIDGSNSSGIFLGNQATGDFTDLRIRNVAHTDAGSRGSFGIGITNASTATVSRVYVDRSEGSPIVVIGFRARIAGSDVVTGALLPTDVMGLTGSGILVDTGAAELTRLYVSEARNSGVAVTGVEGTATYRDLTVTDTLSERTGEVGLGIDVTSGGVATVERASLVSNLAGGAVVSDASASLTLSDVTIQNTSPNESGRFGRGLAAQGGAALTAERIAIADNVEVGLFVHGEGAEVTLRDVVVERTALSEDSGAGNGLVAVEGALVDLERFRIADNALAGIQIATGARVIARDGVVSGSPIGVNVQAASVDPADLSDRVFYVDNLQNLDASALPVPTPSR